MGVRRVELMTSNPAKVKAMEGLIEAVAPLHVAENPHNWRYLECKSEKMSRPWLKSTCHLPNIERCVASRLRIAIVRANWNAELLAPFTSAIYSAFIAKGVTPENVAQVAVPGSWEIVWRAQSIVRGERPHAILCVGLLLKGATLHFDVLSHSVAHGLMEVQLRSGVPIVNGVLNCLTEQQAKERCDPEHSELCESLAATTMHMAELRESQECV